MYMYKRLVFGCLVFFLRHHKILRNYSSLVWYYSKLRCCIEFDICSNLVWLFRTSAPVHWPQRRIYWPTWTSCIHNLVYMCWLHMDKNVVDATHLISHDTYSSLEACEPYHSQDWATMSNYISHGQESTISLL